MQLKDVKSIWFVLVFFLASGTASAFSLFHDFSDDASDPRMKDSIYSMAVTLARTSRDSDFCIQTAQKVMYEGSRWYNGETRLIHLLNAYDKAPTCFGQAKEPPEKIQKYIVSDRKNEKDRPIPKQISNAPLNLSLGLLASPLLVEGPPAKILQIVFSVSPKSSADGALVILERDELRKRISSVLSRKGPSDVTPGAKQQQLCNEILQELQKPLSSKKNIALISVSVTDFVVQPLE